MMLVCWYALVVAVVVIFVLLFASIVVASVDFYILSCKLGSGSYKFTFFAL